MQRIRRILWRVVYPPTWLAALITLPSFALVIWALATGRQDWLAYLSYGLSAYALVVACLRVPDVARAFRTDFEDHPLVTRALDSRFSTDRKYRSEVSLRIGLCINLLYAAVKLVTGVWYRSEWLLSLAGYYVILAALRLALIRPVGGLRARWQRYRLCGVVLLVLNQALAVVVTLVVRRGGSFEYPGILIYVMAAYTFYAFTVAVIHMTKKKPDPISAAASAVSLAAALVAVLSLETAMLSQFGTADQAALRRIFTGATGAAVCTAVLALAVYMIVHSTRQLKELASE